MSGIEAEQPSSGVQVTEMFEDFFKTFHLKGDKTPIYREEIRSMAIYDKVSLEVNVDHIFQKIGMEFVDDMLVSPQAYIERASEAIMAVMIVEEGEYARENRAWGFSARFFKLPPVCKREVRTLRSGDLGSLVELEGIISRLGGVRPEIYRALFICKACNEQVVIEQDSAFFKEPSRCPNTIDCPTKKGPFRLVQGGSTFGDWQKIKVQECPEELDPGQLPSSINVTLRGDLVGILRPGDRIKIAGIFDSSPDRHKVGHTPRQFIPFLVANSIMVQDRDYETVKLTQEEVDSIEKASKDPHIVDKLRESIAPGLWGLDKEKEAVLLALFGGRRKVSGGVVRRGDIHILLIGDPGTGKSSLIRAVHKLASRSIYTSGRGATAAGLTAAAVAEKGGGFSLEAGALILADGGIALIDEFEKMSEVDRASLHQAMEQQEISIAKAGITATLRARTTIVAAANPVGGRFDRAKVPSENIKLPPTLLSRFDLIFTPLDNITDEDLEKEAELILSHSVKGGSGIQMEPPFARDFLKKYISYARQNVHPELGMGAYEKLKKHYIGLRRQGQAPESPVPITMRQLDGLIRLTESYAKMHLRDEATEEDAEDAWDIVYEFLKDVGQESGGGAIDIDALMTGQKLSVRKASDEIMNVMKELSLSYSDFIPREEILRGAEERGVDSSKAERGFELLSRKDLIYKARTDDDVWGIV